MLDYAEETLDEIALAIERDEVSEVIDVMIFGCEQSSGSNNSAAAQLA